MKRLTKEQIRKTILRSLPVLALAAIAFICVPTLLPMSEEDMKKSVVAVECRAHYEIRQGNKTIAVASDICEDTTLTDIKEKPDSDTERIAMTSGCWTDRHCLLPSCRGMIAIAEPFADKQKLHAYISSHLMETIDNTISKTEAILKKNRQRETELNYYLSTHNVKDECYTNIAAYDNANKEERKKMEQSIALMKKLKEGKKLRIIFSESYSALIADGKRCKRIACHALNREKGKTPTGCRMIETNDKKTPGEARPVHRLPFLRPSAEKGDSITTVARFGMNSKSGSAKALQKANTMRGAMLSGNKHDIPRLLAPDGSPIFSNAGYFIGLSMKGEIAR